MQRASECHQKKYGVHACEVQASAKLLLVKSDTDVTDDANDDKGSPQTSLGDSKGFALRIPIMARTTSKRSLSVEVIRHPKHRHQGLAELSEDGDREKLMKTSPVKTASCSDGRFA